jgi:hypothetical protein
MKRRLAAILSLILLITVAVLAAEFSPSTSDPAITDKPADGKCVKGRFECRWGGACVDKGTQCYSCIEGRLWSDGLNKCYSCGEGQTLKQKPSGEYVCSDE